MTSKRGLRYALFAAMLYMLLCTIGGVYVADGTLHPARRALSAEDIASVHSLMQSLDAKLEDTSITASDGLVLRGWLIYPSRPNGSSVIALHGLGDNRLGMVGYARLFLSHGYAVLLPDARAHGTSEGPIATYGLIERNDIHHWVDFLKAQTHAHCVFGFGESMGAAQLLQSLQTKPSFCAIVAESSFSDFREIAYDRMGQPFHAGPWVGRTVLRPMVEVALLRARWKNHVRMEDASPEDAVVGSRIPALLIHGQIDSNIPLRHSRAIHDRAPTAELWEVAGAEHCGAISAAPEEFERRVLAFFHAAM